MRWHQHQYDLETPQAKSIMIRLVWFGRNSRLAISVNDLSWPLIHRIIQPPEGQLESWMIDLFLGCTSPLPDSKGCFSAKSKTCKTCNKLGKEAASLSLLCQRQPSTKPVAHLFKLVILTITCGPGPIWLRLCQPPFPSPWLSNQNTTITSLSNQLLLSYQTLKLSYQIRILLSHHYQTWLRIWSNSSQVEEKNGSLGSLLNGTRPENGLF